MDKPFVICHMLTSLDGKVTGKFLKGTKKIAKTYYGIHRAYGADAFACGRVTMEESFTNGWYPDLTGFKKTTMSRKDYIADNTADYYAVAFDTKGRLGWKESKIIDDDPGYNGAHIIEVLSEQASRQYLRYLQSIGVSYIFAGKESINISLALEKLYQLFGIRKLILEGGSILNGAFHREDLIDELSLVVAPITAATEDKPLFYDGALRRFAFMGSLPYDNGVIWLNYRRPPQKNK